MHRRRWSPRCDRGRIVDDIPRYTSLVLVDEPLNTIDYLFGRAGIVCDVLFDSKSQATTPAKLAIIVCSRSDGFFNMLLSSNPLKIVFSLEGLSKPLCDVD